MIIVSKNPNNKKLFEHFAQYIKEQVLSQHRLWHLIDCVIYLDSNTTYYDPKQDQINIFYPDFIYYIANFKNSTLDHYFLTLFLHILGERFYINFLSLKQKEYIISIYPYFPKKNFKVNAPISVFAFLFQNFIMNCLDEQFYDSWNTLAKLGSDTSDSKPNLDFKIFIYESNGRISFTSLGNNLEPSENDLSGFVVIQKSACGDYYCLHYVDGLNTKLLLDLALEWSSFFAKGLVADKNYTSKESLVFFKNLFLSDSVVKKDLDQTYNCGFDKKYTFLNKVYSKPIYFLKIFELHI